MASEEDDDNAMEDLDEEEDNGKPEPAHRDGEKTPKKAKKDLASKVPTPPGHPNAFLVETWSLLPREILEAWHGTVWAAKQRTLNPNNVVEIPVLHTSTKRATVIWRTYVHGARKCEWSERNLVTGVVTPCAGVPVFFTRTAKCTWCGEHKLFQTSNQIMVTHLAACPQRPKNHGEQSQSSQSLTPGDKKRPSNRQGANGKIIDAAVRMLAALALSFSFFEHPAVLEFLEVFSEQASGHQKGRKTLTINTVKTADLDRKSLLGIIKRMATTLAADGGTINSRKLLGVGAGALSRAFFWKLITVPDTKHLSVAKHLEAAVQNLKFAFVWVLAIVGDNATPMQKGLRIVCKKFGLAALRCACHNIQLSVKDYAKILPFAMEASRVHEYVMQNVGPTETEALKTLGIPKLKKYSNIKWNTEHDAMERLLSAQHGLVQVLPDVYNRFQSVRESVNFFAPFRMATKILECDNASQLQVIACVHAILIHLDPATASSNIDGVLVRDVFLHRVRHNFASPLLLCVFFAIPGFAHKMSEKFPQAAQFILDTVVNVGSAAIENHERLLAAERHENLKPDFEKIIRADMQSNVNRFFQDGRSHPQQQFSTESLLLFWASNMASLGGLALFMVAAIQALPAEAFIERIFSHGKLVLDATRMRLCDRPTEAQMFIKVNDALRRRPHRKPTCEHSGLLHSMTHTPPTWCTLILLAHTMAEAVKEGIHELLAVNLPWRTLATPESDSGESDEDEEGPSEQDEGDEDSD